MEIAISGATGFIGVRLTKYLELGGHNVYPLERELFELENYSALVDIIERCEVVINLAGASVAPCWTRRHRESILESRIIPTRKIVQAINQCSSPKTLISASAVGYYPSRGCYDEESRVENYSFLAYVCRLWEREALRLNHTSRLVIARFGVVFSHSAGALQTLTATRVLGFLPRIGSPEKPITWVDREDLVRALEFIIENDAIDGVVNIVSPRFTLQRDLLDAAHKRYNTLFTLPIHPLLLKAIYGKASEMITSASCVSSQKLTSAGFEFISQSIADFFSRKTTWK